MAGHDVILGDLDGARRSLLARWHATQEVWSDPVSERFESEFVAPLDMECRAMLAVMAEAFGTIIQARRQFGLD